jgi:ATP-dependent RNA circularization protein (DNA/RNA ligase family)
MNDHELERMAEKIAEKMKGSPVNHICPFTAETVASLKDLAFYFSTAQKAFKGFIILCIVIGAIAAFLIGLKTKIMEFWATL